MHTHPEIWVICFFGFFPRRPVCLCFKCFPPSCHLIALSAGYNAPGGACLLSVKEVRRFLHPRAFLPQNDRNTAFYALGLGLVFCMRLFVRQYVQPVTHRNAAFGFCRGASHLLESHFAAPAFLMLCRHASSLALFARSISMCTRILFLMLIALAPFLSPTLGVGIRGRACVPGCQRQTLSHTKHRRLCA